ncbi:CBS domain-containing protein [Lentibacillus halodurans]|uniref:CBS domain-containing protein n=1 Tax=Lentibacillus halodurans TaxID=237679 RepID=A0A1I0VFZ3_9BACI|nr:CBS domain-containing protein [Lentibacillus halodurans]SFA75138.1 CBS domain-containing protein [Lentibacillus halodurans]
MKINDFMITDVISVQKNIKIKELLRTLVKYKIGGVPVVDENNRLRGMISDGDVIRYLQPNGRTIYDAFSMVFVNKQEDFKQKIESSIDHHSEKIMKKNVYTVNPDDHMEEALSIFSNYHFKKIPVVDHETKVVGVISRGDIIRFISTNLISKTDE